MACAPVMQQLCFFFTSLHVKVCTVASCHICSKRQFKCVQQSVDGSNQGNLADLRA